MFLKFYKGKNSITPENKVFDKMSTLENEIKFQKYLVGILQTSHLMVDQQ
jgi:hypothetical protein